MHSTRQVGNARIMGRLQFAAQGRTSRVKLTTPLRIADVSRGGKTNGTREIRPINHI
jgi:hypothetical protein